MKHWRIVCHWDWLEVVATTSAVLLWLFWVLFAFCVVDYLMGLGCSS